MKTPHRCPLCNGTGFVPAGFYSAIGVNSFPTTNTAPEQCRSCSGLGILWSDDEAVTITVKVNLE